MIFRFIRINRNSHFANYRNDVAFILIFFLLNKNFHRDNKFYGSGGGT